MTTELPLECEGLIYGDVFVSLAIQLIHSFSSFYLDYVLLCSTFHLTPVYLTGHSFRSIGGTCSHTSIGIDTRAEAERNRRVPDTSPPQTVLVMQYPSRVTRLYLKVLSYSCSSLFLYPSLSHPLDPDSPISGS